MTQNKLNLYRNNKISNYDIFKWFIRCGCAAWGDSVPLLDLCVAQKRHGWETFCASSEAFSETVLLNWVNPSRSWDMVKRIGQFSKIGKKMFQQTRQPFLLQFISISVENCFIAVREAGILMSIRSSCHPAPAFPI